MTPAVNQVKKEKIIHTVHKYKHSSACASYGTEAAEKLGLSESVVFKTLVVKIDKSRPVVVVLPVSSMLSMKRIASAAGGKKAAMAGENEVIKSTGYVFGGVSPLNLAEKSLGSCLEKSVLTLGANRICTFAGVS